MSTTDTRTPSSRPHPARHIALEQYVRKIRAEVMRSAGKGRGHGALRLRIGSRALALEPWILESLVEVSVAPDESSPSGLLLEAVAFAAKCLHDMETLGTTERRDIHRIHALEAELMLDVALGTALLREVQSRIDAVVQSGKLDRAKDWNRLRQTIHDIVTASKESLGETEAKEADQLSWEFSGVARSSDTAAADRQAGHRPIMLPRPGSAPPLPGSAQAGQRRRPANRESVLEDQEFETEPPRASLSLAIASVIAIIGVALLLWGRGAPAAPAAHLDVSQLPGAARVASFEPRAMSATITVRDDAWNELDERAKLGWVNDLGRTLAKSGHKGVVLRSGSGRPLAQWLSGRGATLLDSRDVVATTAPAKDVGRKKLH